MWWPEPAGRRALAAGLALGLALAAAGCGFRPLYERGGGPDCEGPGAAAHMAAVRVAPIPDRAGQILRNALSDALAPGGRAGGAAYRLDVALEETRTDLVIRRDSASTFAKLRATGRWTLSDAATGKALTRGRSEATAVFNIVESGYANLNARRAARERAARAVAADIHARLALFFRRHAGCGSRAG